MDYHSMSKDALIERIKALESTLQTVLVDEDKGFQKKYPWAGNLGQWFWDFQQNQVTFNPKKAEGIGYDKADLPDHVPYHFFTDKLHPDDYEPVMQNMRDHLALEREAYEVEYRIRHRDGSYRWYYDRGAVTHRDADGKPLFLTGIVFDITESKRREADLIERQRAMERRAEHDDLTGLFTRKALMERYQQAVKHSKKAQRPITVAMLDLDDFKVVNDTKGHPYGDKILKTFAKTLRQSVRENDIVGRYGGEEFLIVFSSASPEAVKDVCERLRTRVQTALVADGVTVSIGLALHRDGLNATILEADKALYDAKRKGKNRIEIAP